jgi:DNA-binding MarR family transcriptional regulator
MPRYPKAYVIRRADQLAALSSPTRWQVVEALSVQGPGSVRDLAARTGRKPVSLYYHVRALLDVGLVVQDTTRHTGRRAEAVYGLVAPRLIADRNQTSPAHKEALCRSCEAFLRLAARDHRAAVERGDLVFEGPQRNLMVRRQAVKLRPQALKKANRLLDRVAAELDRLSDPEAPDTHAVTVVLTRLPDRGH